MRYLRENLALILIISFLAPWASLISFYPQIAAAQGVVGQAAGSIGGTSATCLAPYLREVLRGSAIAATDAATKVGVTNFQLQTAAGGTAGGAETLSMKECVIKPIIILIAKTLLAQLTRSIVNWINTGFKGNPAFVTDFRKFLLDVGDQVIGEFIYGSDLSFLCSPFQLQVRIALALNYQGFDNRARCTLSSVIGNVNNAYTNFSSGGWPGWFSVTTNPQNNPYGAYMMAQSELSIRIANAQYTNTKLLDFGKGFFSFQKCADGPTSSVNTGSGSAPATNFSYSYTPINVSPSANCQIVTPGAVIEDQLEEVLGSEIRQLELANDINSIIAALVGQLIKQGLTALGGISGLSQPSPQFGGGTALDTLVINATDAQIRGRQDAGITLTNNAIQKAQRYLDVKQGTLNRVLDAESELKNLQACYQYKIDNSQIFGEDRNEADRRILQASTTIVAQVNPRKAPLSAQMLSTQNAIDQAYLLQNKIAAATTQEELDAASTEYSALIESGALPSDTDIVIATQEQRDITAQMDLVIQDTRLKLDACAAFPPPPQTTL